MIANTKLSVVLERYRGAGSLKSVKRGLDDRSFIFEISGRREMRILAVVYDPSSDGNLQEFVEDLMDSYGRAGVDFERLDLWIPESLYRKAQELLEEAERRKWKWSRSVTLWPLPVPLSSEGPELEEGKRISRVREIEPVRIKEGNRNSDKEIRFQDDEVRGAKEIRALIKEMGREISEGIAKSLEESFKSLISSIDLRKSDPELISKIYELEKRIELLESFIRLLGTQGGVIYVPQQLREPPSIKFEDNAPVTKITSPIDSVNFEKREEREMEVNLGASERSFEVRPDEAGDVLTEIFNNPWVSILSKKGDEVES